MNLSLLPQAASQVQAQWLVLGLYEDENALPNSAWSPALNELLGRLREEKELTGSLGELTPLHGVPEFSAVSLLIAGLGPKGKFDSGSAYSVGVTVAKRLAAKQRQTVAVEVPSSEEPEPELVSALIEGMIVGTHSPGLCKAEPNRHAFENLKLVIAPGTSAELIREIEKQTRRGEVVGQAVNLARRLANTPPSEKPPARLADQIRTLASDAGIAVQVWDETRLRQERFGGLLAVAAGSEQPPAFVVLHYHQGGNAPTTALVGKGVTFDSGGLSLKPSASMEDMKSDMTGAAVVVATLQAIARLRLPVNVTGYLALTENMTGGRAMKLGDVLTIRNGKTVEVMNTDAEGRLILADALSFAVENRPARLLDLATLTGACMVALGTRLAGLFTNDDLFSEAVLAACRKTGERAWRLPLDDDFKEQLKSDVADLKNVGSKWGGAVTAAKFLEQFVDSTPWVHLDIAGPSWNDSENSSRDAGATGCFVRTLVTYLEGYADQEDSKV